MSVATNNFKLERSPMSEGLWLILRVGMVIGLIPLRLNTKIGKLDFQLSYGRSFPILYALYTLFANLIVFMFAIILFFRELGAEAKLVEQFLDMVYHSHLIITILTILFQCRKIPKVLEEWDKVEFLFKPYEKREKILFGRGNRKLAAKMKNRHGEFIRVIRQGQSQSSHKSFETKSKIISGAYAASVLLGAVGYFSGIAIKESCNTTQEYLTEVAKIYIIEEACSWWTGIYVVFIGHTMEFIWAYGDMLILSVSYALCYQFKRFNTIIENVCKDNLSPRDIENLRILYSAISKATKETNGVLSTLTTMVFLCNILYLFSRVYNGLAKDLSHPHFLVKIEAIYAFLYLVVRIFATAVVATKFYSASRCSFKPLARSRFYGNTYLHFLITDRFCNQLLTSNVAISGRGYFYLNQSFIAALLSALVTYEVVILQFSASSKQPIS